MEEKVKKRTISSVCMLIVMVCVCMMPSSIQAVSLKERYGNVLERLDQSDKWYGYDVIAYLDINKDKKTELLVGSTAEDWVLVYTSINGKVKRAGVIYCDPQDLYRYGKRASGLVAGNTVYDRHTMGQIDILERYVLIKGKLKNVITQQYVVNYDDYGPYLYTKNGVIISENSFYKFVEKMWDISWISCH